MLLLGEFLSYICGIKSLHGMKKLYAAIIILICFATGDLKAQSLQAQNATLYLQGDGASIIQGFVDIYNVSATDLDVLVERVIDDLAPGHESNFCWGQFCFGSSTSLSPFSEPIPAGDYNQSFRGDLDPHGLMGLSRVTYCFFDELNPADSICMEFVYDVALGINENASYNYLSAPYPNPADGFTKISYGLAAPSADVKIVLHNMLGEKMKEFGTKAQQKSFILNTSSLRQGVYFYSLVAGGKVISTSKLVVGHKN